MGWVSPRTKSRSARLGLWTMVVSGCAFELETPRRSTIECAADSECPAGFRCSSDLRACVLLANDQRSPQVLSATLAPAVIGAGDPVRVTVTVSEPLFAPPALTLPGGGALALDSVVDSTTYVYRYVSVPEDSPAVPLTITMFDLDGNRTSEPLIEIPIDTAPPALNDLAWTDGLEVANGSSVLTFSGETSIDSTAVAELVDASGIVVLELVVGRIATPSGLTLVGALDLGTLSFSLVEQFEAFNVRLTVSDAVGNALIAPLPARRVDVLAPHTRVTNSPSAAPTTRQFEIAFDSPDEDATDFECRITPAPYSSCASPWLIDVNSNGPFNLEVRAVDRAGNADPSPWALRVQVDPVWASVRSANEFSCGISTDRRLWCWGNGSSAAAYTAQGALNPTLISDERDWSEVFVGHIDAACARSADDQMYCWGRGPLGDGTAMDTEFTRPTRVPGGPWQSLAIANGHRCGLRVDGTMWCWGDNRRDAVGAGLPLVYLEPQQVGSDADWISVDTAFSNASCGLRALGSETRAFCWGSAQLGGGASGPIPVEVEVEGVGPVGDWLSLSVGGQTSCGVRRVSSDAGTLWCWGRNRDGEVGQNDLLPFPQSTFARAVQVGSETDWVQVSVGTRRVCALRQDGSAWCWGGDEYRLDGSRDETVALPIPVENPTPWTEVAVGSEFTCGIGAIGALTCLGANARGQLGGGTAATVLAPLEPVAGPSLWDDFATYDAVGCGISAGGLYCWGTSRDGVDGTMDGDNSVPTPVGTDTDWVEVVRGADHTCGIREDGLGNRRAWCLGNDSRGALGDAATGGISVDPVLVGTGGTVETQWQTLSASRESTFAILENSPGVRTLWRWGTPPNQTSALALPSAVGAEDDWLAVDAGDRHVCGIRGEVGGNTLWCWGDGSRYRLGLGAEDDYAAPQQVGVGESYAVGWVAVSAGGEGTCAVREENLARSLWCWGGQGEDSTTLRVPTERAALDLGSLAVGFEGGCGLERSGALWCWENVPGISNPEDTPRRVHAGVTFASIHLADRNLCAIDDGGQGYCAGSDGDGQRGSGVTWGPFSPGVPP